VIACTTITREAQMEHAEQLQVCGASERMKNDKSISRGGWKPIVHLLFIATYPALLHNLHCEKPSRRHSSK